MCKIKTSLTKESKKRLLTISPITRTRKHKLKHLFTLHTIKLQTHNQERLRIQRGPDKRAENAANRWFPRSQVTSGKKDPALLHCSLSSFLKLFEVRHSPRCPSDPTHYGNFYAHHSLSWTQSHSSLINAGKLLGHLQQLVSLSNPTAKAGTQKG